MARRPRALDLARWALRSPGAATRLVRTEWVRGAVMGSEMLPASIRVPAFDTIARAAAQATRSEGDHAIALPIQVFARNAASGRHMAVGVIEAEGRGATPRTAARLARLAVAMDAAAAADALVAGIDTDLPDAIRGEVELAAGRYRAALQHLGLALRAAPGDRRLRRLLARAHGEVALLDPAWRPSLGPVERTGPPVRGRVIHLLTNSLPERQAGYTLRAQQVARSQLAVGLDPVMVTRAGFPGVEGSGRPAERVEIDGVPYLRIAPDRGPETTVDVLASETAAGLDRLVRELRPAALHPTTNYVNAQVALAVGEAHGIPVVYEVRGFLEETWRSRMGDGVTEDDRYAGARAVETASMRRATAIVTLSETMRADILARGGIAEEQVIVVPNAVDVDRFRPGPRDDALAAALGIAPDEVVLGYISSFNGYEGIRYLIEAGAELRRRGRRIRVLLVGSGDDTGSLRTVAERTGLLADGTVIFTGRVPHDDVERYYRTIDIFVVPRTADRVSQLVTPLKPYEAMAMEKTLVVSRVGALLEIVREGETGVTFEAENALSLADAVEPLLDDGERRAELGRAARAWVTTNRTWAQNGERYLELYRRLGIA